MTISSLQPRVVIVTRDSDYEVLLARHATREAVRFHLASRGQQLDEVEARHRKEHEAIRQVRAALPRQWRQAAVRRSALDRFLFQPDDIVAAIGQDGLIANVAKYVTAQPVIGINPDPAHIDGVLARIGLADAAEALLAAAHGRARIESRAMVAATLDGSQSLLALNEIFVGHRSHQSARYRIAHAGQSELHSSSGLIVTTGTGASGWARSIMAATGQRLALDPCQRQAGFFVREAWPSRTTGTALLAGAVTEAAPLVLTSQMEGGTVFADGMEQDFLPFAWGTTLSISPAARGLNLVVG